MRILARLRMDSKSHVPLVGSYCFLAELPRRVRFIFQI